MEGEEQSERIKENEYGRKNKRGFYSFFVVGVMCIKRGSQGKESTKPSRSYGLSLTRKESEERGRERDFFGFCLSRLVLPTLAIYLFGKACS